MLAWLSGMQVQTLHIAQQMPLPLTVTCSSKSRLVLTLLVLPSGTCSPGWSRTYSRRAVKRLCVCVCVLVLKSNETWKFDISDCHSLLTVQNPAKNSLFEDVFKVSASSFHTSSKSFDKAQYCLLDGVLCICLQDFLQLVNGIWLGLKCLVAFKHSFRDMIIKRIKVW